MTKEIEDRTVRLGDGGVKLPETKEGCEDTREFLAEDEQFWADLDESRSTKQGEWVSRCKLRTEEIPAIVDTNKILNEDEALEVLGKTLPGVAARLQVEATSKEMKQMTLAALQGVKGNVGVDLFSMALKGNKVSVDKVMKMVDDMVRLLGDEQRLMKPRGAVRGGH